MLATLAGVVGEGDAKEGPGSAPAGRSPASWYGRRVVTRHEGVHHARVRCVGVRAS